MGHCSQRFTVEFVFHSGRSLPIADIHNLSSDPYILASLVCPELPPRRDDPSFTWRTQTLRQTRDPTWDSAWNVAGIPSSGFRLELKLKDEDAHDRDDRLGKAYLDVRSHQMVDGFTLNHEVLKIMKRKGSIVPYITTYFAAVLPGQHLVLHPCVELSLRISAMKEECRLDRPYTIGPNKYTRHFSPLIGRAVLAKEITNQQDSKPKRVSASCFIANKLQLSGPVPSALRHRFVPYRPLIDWLFLKSGPWGWVLNAGLRKQYRTIYSYDKNTVFGVSHSGNSRNNLVNGDTSNSGPEIASILLEMTCHGEGARIYTYVITLDGEWRFCETGEEFAIDLLSKHSMHADVAKEVAFSGEFFVRRKQHSSSHSRTHTEHKHLSVCARDYELIIDNDSGTYRPKKELLPVLQAWLSLPENLAQLGGIIAMDGFDETLIKWKNERKEAKKAKKSIKKVKLARSNHSISSIGSSELGGGGNIDSGLVEVSVNEHDREHSC